MIIVSGSLFLEKILELQYVYIMKCMWKINKMMSVVQRILFTSINLLLQQ